MTELALEQPELPEGAVRVGRLGRTHGLEGALRCLVPGEREAAAVLASAHLFVAGHGRLHLRLARAHRGSLLVAFQGLRSPERAQELVNADVYVEAGSLPASQEAQLIERLHGAEVLLDGSHYGRVVEVHTRGQLLLRVAGEAGERWLPGEAPYVRIEPGVVRVDDPPPGLLEED